MAHTPKKSSGPKASNVKEIINAIQLLDDRGLIHATLWLREYLDSLEVDDKDFEQDSHIDFSNESTKYILAKTHFIEKEYRRCHHTLIGSTSQRSLFLQRYALFLAGEKKKCEDSNHFIYSATQVVRNPELPTLRDELSTQFAARELDAFGCYLYGLVLREGQDPLLVRNSQQKDHTTGITIDTARDVFIESLSRFPWNWSAWQDLSSILYSETSLEFVNRALPDSFPKRCFVANAYQRLGHFNKSCSLFSSLISDNPGFSWLQRQFAVSLAGANEISKSLPILENLRKTDPYSFESMEVYAKCLAHSKKDAQSRLKLSQLATESMEASKHTPASYMIMAHVHWLQGSGALVQAMNSKALQLDASLTSAWAHMAENMDPAVEAQFANAMHFLRKAQFLAPHDASVRAKIGASYVFQSLPHAYFNLFEASRTAPLSTSDLNVVKRGIAAAVKKAKKEGDAEDLVSSIPSSMQGKVSKVSGKLPNASPGAHDESAIEDEDVDESRGEMERSLTADTSAGEAKFEGSQRHQEDDVWKALDAIISARSASTKGVARREAPESAMERRRRAMEESVMTPSSKVPASSVSPSNLTSPLRMYQPPQTQQNMSVGADEEEDEELLHQSVMEMSMEEDDEAQNGDEAGNNDGKVFTRAQFDDYMAGISYAIRNFDEQLLRAQREEEEMMDEEMEDDEVAKVIAAVEAANEQEDMAMEMDDDI